MIVPPLETHSPEGSRATTKITLPERGVPLISVRYPEMEKDWLTAGVLFVIFKESLVGMELPIITLHIVEEIK